MAKITLSDVTSGYASTTVVNANNAAIETALENTLSRDGTGPNQMGAALDMNGFNILNQGNPITISGFNWEGAWLTGTTYQVGDVVQEAGAAYICIVEHTAGTFATDLSALKWEIVVQANLPAQAGNAAKFLQTDGNNPSWQVPDAAEVSFTQAGTGAVATTVDNKLNQFVSVIDFGADPTGVADSAAAIQAAVDYIETLGGGTVYFPQGTFLVSATIESDDHGVMLVGEGEGKYYSTVSAETVTTPATIIKYTGSGTPVIRFTCTAGEYAKSGGGVEKIFIHCGDGVGLAEYGITVISRGKLTIRNVTIFNATVAGLLTKCYPGLLASAVSGYDVQHCTFENITHSLDNANTTGGGLHLTGGQGNGGAGQGNTSFNTFINTRWQGSTLIPAVSIGDTDNNTFVALRANGGGTEEPITTGAIEFLSVDETGTGAARYNNIFGCEAAGGVYARASQTGATSSFLNNIYGYNISNGGIAPLIETGAGGSSDATLSLFGYRVYAPDTIIFPNTGTVDFTNTSNSIADSRTVTYSKLALVEQGNLDATAMAIQGTTAAGTCNYTLRTGSYSRVGNLVFVNMYFTYDTHTGTGNIRIAGLPFTSAATTRNAILNVLTSNLTFSGALHAQVESSAKTLLLKSSATGAALADVAMDAAASIYISGVYTVA